MAIDETFNGDGSPMFAMHPDEPWATLAPGTFRDLEAIENVREDVQEHVNKYGEGQKNPMFNAAPIPAGYVDAAGAADITGLNPVTLRSGYTRVYKRLPKYRFPVRGDPVTYTRNCFPVEECFRERHRQIAQGRVRALTNDPAFKYDLDPAHEQIKMFNIRKNKIKYAPTEGSEARERELEAYREQERAHAREMLQRIPLTSGPARQA